MKGRTQDWGLLRREEGKLWEGTGLPPPRAGRIGELRWARRPLGTWGGAVWLEHGDADTRGDSRREETAESGPKP